MTFECDCDQTGGYEGRYCESMIDLCKNETCSKNGICKQNANMTTSCDCFKMFKGEKCELTTEEKKIIENTISASTATAIIILSTLFGSFILSDMITLWNNNFNIKIKKIKKPKKPIRIKFIYIN